MITDWIGQHEVLLPVNRNYKKKMHDFLSFFEIETLNIQESFASSEEKKHI